MGRAVVFQHPAGPSRRAASALLLCALAAPAYGHGGLPASENVRFRPADLARLLLATNFGLLLSSDGGAHFYWICQDAIGYRGSTYDPDFEIGADGALWVSTFDGLRRSLDDGCTFESDPGVLGTHSVGDIEIGGDGRVWVVTDTGTLGNDVFSGGVDGFTATGITPTDALWHSVRVAPSDPMRVYVVGETNVDDVKYGQLRRSENGGASWDELPVTAFGDDPRLRLLGVSPTDPDVVFVWLNGPVDDVMFRSEDGGETWNEVLRLQLVASESFAFTARADGQHYLAGSRSVGVRDSSDAGKTWTTPPVQFQMGCVGERGDGELFACGWNWAPDNFALGRSEDADVWTKVVRWSEIAGPLACPAGTVQHDTCAALLWPDLADMYGIGDADAGPVTIDAGAAPDAGGGGGGGGCGGCSMAMAGVLVVLPRRRRRTERSS